MAWYYYSGKVAIPIQVKKGVSMSVKSGTKFEVLENTEQLEILKQRKVIRPTTPDKKAVPVESLVVPILAIKEVVAPSKFAATIVDSSDKKEEPVVVEKTIVDEKTTVETEEVTKEIEPEAQSSEDESVRVVRRRRKSGAPSTEINNNE